MIYTVARGGLTMPQALAAAARNPGADVIDVWGNVWPAVVIPIPDRPAPEAGPR